MKKILFSLLAVAALASCMKEQTLSVAEGSKIGFAGSFVENATRAAANPSTTTDNIEEFFVWGVMDNETGIVFDDERVYKANGGWTYDETQYWTPNHTYYFSALAGDRSNDQIVLDLAADADNGMSVDGLGTMTFTNVEGVNDVLYAESTRTTGAAITTQPEDVKFQFSHLLSKVKFSFTNGFVNENNAIIVKNIKMTVPETGVIDLTKDAYEWTNLAGETVLDMGHMAAGANVLAGKSASSDNERLTIPAAATQEYTVTFDVELYMGAVLASSASKTVKINGCLLESGKAYNFKAILNQENIDENPLFPITFDAVVEEWVEEEYDGGAIPTNAVSTAAELQAALTAGGLVTLARDIELPKTLVLDQPVATTIDLNGKNLTVTTTSNELGEGDGIIATAGELVIKGEGTVTANTRAVWARGNGGAKITIEGGEFVGATNGACEVIYASGNGQITVLGGTFEAATEDQNSFAAPQYAALNLHGNGKDGCNIVVYGGSFKNFDPTDNVSENPKKNFCADGYSATKVGDYYVVGKTVATVADLSSALNTEPVVNVDQPIDNGSNTINVTGGDVVMNGNGNKTTAGGMGTNNYAFTLANTTYVGNDLNIEGAGFAVLGESDATINSAEINAIPQKSGRNLFYVIQNSTVTINDGYYYSAYGKFYFFYVEAGSTVYINGGTFEKPLANNASVDVLVKNGSTGTVVITGGKFVHDPTNWLAPGYKAEKSGKWWTVSAE